MKFIKSYILFEHQEDWSILDGLIFQHQSMKDLKTLKPQTYEEIAKERKNDEYMEGRIETERDYHEMIPGRNEESFLYATIVGYNEMDSVDEFPGNTYYFRMTKEQIRKCIFEVVDKELSYGPIYGLVGLHGAINFWKKNSHLMEPYEDEVVGGEIQPRIEVIIGCEIDDIWKVKKNKLKESDV